MFEARYTVKVDYKDDDKDPLVKIYHQGRLIHLSTPSTLGKVLGLGMTITSKKTPALPTLDIDD